MRRVRVSAGIFAVLIIAAGAVLQSRFAWRVPVNGSGIPTDVTAQSLRSRRTLAELRRAGMQTTRSSLVINEIMALNPGTVLDERLTASDWVELYNKSDEPIDLEGFALSDSRSASRRWMFPDVLLPPRECLLVWCSGRDEINTPLSRVLRMVPTSREPWTMKYDDRAPGGIAVRFKGKSLEPPHPNPLPQGEREQEGAALPQGEREGNGEDPESVDPYVVAVNVPEAGDYVVSLLAVSSTEPWGALSVAVDGGDGLVMPVPAGDDFRWVDFDNPTTQDGTWPLGAGLHRIALRGGRGEVRVAELACRDRSRTKPHQFLHTDFRLAASGESVILTDPDGNILDYVTPPPMPPGQTYQRTSDGADEFTVGFPSPGGTMLVAPPDLSNLPTFSESPITVDPPFVPGTDELRYTLDGSAPTISDPLFTDSLPLPLPLGEPACPSRRVAGRGWGEGQKRPVPVVLSVRGFTGGMPSTDTVIRQFWVGLLPDVPVLCVATEPAHLDYTDLGIFNRRKKRGRDWERRAHVLLFDGENVAFDGLAGLRSHGWRHPDRTQNSFHINFRPSFGEDRLRYNILNPASSVHPRCIIADASGHGWADHLAYEVARGLGGVAPHARPALIFINGRPYNLGTLVENVDESFLLDRWGHTDFDVIKRKPRRLKLGTWDRYGALKEHVRDEINLERMTTASIGDLLDTDSLTSWMLTIILCDASEGGKHITREAFQGYFYSDRAAPSPNIGMIAWDVDCSFRCVDYNTLEGIMTKARSAAPVGAFRALVKNDAEYVRQFRNAAQHAVDHVFTENLLFPTIDLYENLYHQHARHCIIGSNGGADAQMISEEALRAFRSKWREVFATARRVVRERPTVVLQDIDRYRR